MTSLIHSVGSPVYEVISSLKERGPDGNIIIIRALSGVAEVAKGLKLTGQTATSVMALATPLSEATHFLGAITSPITDLTNTIDSVKAAMRAIVKREVAVKCQVRVGVGKKSGINDGSDVVHPTSFGATYYLKSREIRQVFRKDFAQESICIAKGLNQLAEYVDDLIVAFITLINIDVINLASTAAERAAVLTAAATGRVVAVVSAGAAITRFALTGYRSYTYQGSDDAERQLLRAQFKAATFNLAKTALRVALVVVVTMPSTTLGLITLGMVFCDIKMLHLKSETLPVIDVNSKDFTSQNFEGLELATDGV